MRTTNNNPLTDQTRDAAPGKRRENGSSTHYGQFPHGLAAKHMFSDSCHIYEICDTNMVFCFQKTNFRDKFLNRAYSEIVGFVTYVAYRPLVRLTLWKTSKRFNLVFQKY